MAIDVGFLDSTAVKVFAGVFAGAASALTIHQIILQLKNFHNRKLQILVCRILFMVPIYSLASFLPLVMGQNAFVIGSLKDCYEAFLIYTFLAYIFELLGEESDIVGRIQEGGMEEVPGSRINYFANFVLLGGPGLVAYPLYGTFFPPWEIDGRFLQACKRGTMQFVFLKPILAVLEIIFFYTHLLHQGNLNPKYLYVYFMIIWNIIYGTALYYLVLFFTATKPALQQHRPWLKFGVVKGIVFVTFWQGIAIAILVELGVITSSTHEDDWSEIAGELQSVLTCIEMLGFAIAHRYAFPPDEHTNSQLDMHLESIGVQKQEPDETSDTHQPISKMIMNGVGVVSNFLSVLSPRDLCEDTARNFSLKYHGLTKLSNVTDDEDPELIAVSSEMSMLSDDDNDDSKENGGSKGARDDRFVLE